MNNKYLDLIGKRFGHLIVLDYIAGSKDTKAMCVCRCDCDCGKIKNIRKSSLVAGTTKTCGCHMKPFVWRRHYPKLFQVWKNMKARCEVPSNKEYHNYGARNIGICPEWQDAGTFCKWALATGWHAGVTIDRIDNNKGYSPDNCRWATWMEQAQNRRNTYRFDGKTVREWTEVHPDRRWILQRLLIKRIQTRIERGMDGYTACVTTFDRDRHIVAEFLDTFDPALTERLYPAIQ